MEIKIGDRVQCECFCGTVRYLGEVPPTAGTWLGVDWDDPCRGKHDGSHNGKRYFQASSPTSGSFIRPNRCDSYLEFCDAVKQRYLIEDDACFADENMLRELQGMMKASLLEVVGLEKIGKKQSNLELLAIAVLDHMRIKSTGPHGLISRTCPNIQELNLAGNLLSSWECLANITKQLPCLEILNISKNRLDILNNCDKLQPAFAKLKSLIMGQMDYTWEDILLCSSMWPQLESLSVPKNNVTRLGTSPPVYLQNLKHLNLEGNHIETWEEINVLGHLPNLESLSLYETGLRNIIIADDNLFPKLLKLSVSNNRILKWRNISELDKLPCLMDLKITGNPDLPADSAETRLQLIVARIGNLKVLNGSEISADERRGAEVDYLKKYGRDYLAHLSDLSDFLKEHPRYPVLVKKYGPPEAEEVEQKPVTLKSSLLNLRITFQHTIEKKLPASLTVQKLKTLCQRLFKLDNMELFLYCISAKNPDIRVFLDNDMRPISNYSVEDGDEISIECGS